MQKSLSNVGLIVGFCCLNLLSCGSGNSAEQRLLDDAYEKQTEAIQLISQIEDRVESSSFQRKDSLLEAIEELEEGLFAIPGHTLNLPGHEGHDHSHSRVELSAEDIFKVQEELVSQLHQIQNTLKNQ